MQRYAKTLDDLDSSERDRRLATLEAFARYVDRTPDRMVEEIYNRETRKYRKRGFYSDNAKAFASEQEGPSISSSPRATSSAPSSSPTASGSRPSGRVGCEPATVIACLGGGIGAARLWRALLDVVGADALSIVVNTADDVWRHGLRVCPDVDTNLYWLSGRADRERGWGLRDETFRCMDALRELGGDPWFALGDADLATHLLRTAWLRDGVGLAEVTDRLASAMSGGAAVLPVCEQEVGTEVRVERDGWIGYQDFLVRRGAGDPVLDARWAGVEASTPAPGVLEAIGGADLIVLGPSNPMASLLPVIDAADAGEVPEVAAHGLEPIVAPTLVHLDERVAEDLVERLLSATQAAA